MACRLLGTKPLPEPMLAYCQLASWEQISVKIFIQENAFEIVVCQVAAILSRGRWVNKLFLTNVDLCYNIPEFFIYINNTACYIG